MEIPERFKQLEQMITDLRAELATEVRTRRLVVVSDDGFERIVAGSATNYGSLAVRGRSYDGEKTSAELFANDPMDADSVNVGVCLNDRGNVVASLDVFERERLRLWFDGDEQDEGAPRAADVPGGPDHSRG